VQGRLKVVEGDARHHGSGDHPEYIKILKQLELDEMMKRVH